MYPLLLVPGSTMVTRWDSSLDLNVSVATASAVEYTLRTQQQELLLYFSPKMAERSVHHDTQISRGAHNWYACTPPIRDAYRRFCVTNGRSKKLNTSSSYFGVSHLQRKANRAGAEENRFLRKVAPRCAVA